MKEPDQTFVADIEAIRRWARQSPMDGAVTEGYAGNAKVACEVLNHALATEILCVLRYKAHFYAAEGILAQPAKEEFLQHAAEEQSHADRIAERIIQLGGVPNFSPDGLSGRAHSMYECGDTLRAMIEEDLVAERIVIDVYREMVSWFAPFDTTTRKMLEDIQASEEEHADDLAELLKRFPTMEK